MGSFKRLKQVEDVGKRSVSVPGLKKLITELPSEYPSSLESFVMALTVKGGCEIFPNETQRNKQDNYKRIYICIKL
eukprot:m.230524 g.230524  ORF g.230524 m.230524 type:complete len:76 (-) comp16000_c0_seq8:3244-3471(-)